MILTFLLSLNGLLMAGNSTGQDLSKIEISVDMKGLSLKGALQKIASITHIPFSYRIRDVAAYPDVSYSATNKSAGRVLDELLSVRGLQYEMVNGNIIIKKVRVGTAVTSALAPINASRQSDGGIKGRITNQRGEPVANASIVLLGKTQGASADEKGYFSFSNIKPGSYQVQVSAVGYGTEVRTIVVSDDKIATLDLQLSDRSSMTEVTVTALGIRKEKRTLGYSAQEVGGEAIEGSHQPNIVNALQGQAAGLQINSGGGAPGQGAKIILRGINSLDASRDFQPLFVIDGIPIDNTTDVSDGSDLKGVSNRAADINPDDIESVNILKGGAATALYGLRASTGAIIITTKSGKAGKLRGSFTSTGSTDRINKAPETQQLYTQGWLGVYDSTSFWPAWGPTIEKAKSADPTHPDHLFNNYKHGYKTGHSIRNSLNLSGGTEKAIFSASFSQFNQDGIMPFTDYRNYSGKVSGEFKFSDKFRFGTSVNYINSGGRHGDADRYNEDLSYFSPRWDIWNYLLPDGAQKTILGSGNDNPIYVLYGKKYVDDVNRLIGNAHFTYSPVKWLDISYRAGVDRYNDTRTQTTPGILGLPDEIYPANDFDYGQIFQYAIQHTVLNSTLVLNFKNNIGKHLNSSFKIGHDVFQTRRTSVYTEGDTLIVPTLFMFDNAKKVIARSKQTDYRIIGLFGDWTLGWDNFLYLDITGRNDWTSTLPVQNRSFFYPSASLSWIFSENFRLPAWASFGKLRFSAAKVGKDALPYATSTGYFINAPLAPIPAQRFERSTQEGDANLRPEFTTSYEAGAELKFLGNRLGLDFTYYNNTSKDLLIPVKVPVSTGDDQIYLNAGSIRNQGVEISLNGTLLQTKDFRWDMRVNYTNNHNKVLSIYPGLTEIPLATQFGYLSSTVTQKFIPGMPVGALYGRTYQRYFGSAHEDPTVLDRSKPIVIGANGFPVLNSASKQQYLANSQPSWIGNLSTTFRYKHFSLFLLFDTQQGVYRYNQLGNFMAAFGLQKGSLDRNDTKVFKGVLADGTPNTKAVWLGQGVGPDGVNYGNGYYRNIYRGGSETFVENASWLRLRTASISYAIPESVMKKTGFLNGATLSASANNLWIHTRWSGFDPESSSTAAGNVADGFNGFSYPATRSYILSLNLNF
jgi:TonB-linked SusC/RagA family outer membrane protein